MTVSGGSSPADIRPRRATRSVRRGALVLLALVALLFALAGAYLGWARLRPLDLHVTAPGYTVDSAGTPAHVEHWAATHPRGPPALTLVPGFAESTYVWSRVAPLLAANREVYTYDVTGYGYSAHVPPYTLEADTDQLTGMITALHLDRPIVVGHSLGVAIALSLAPRNPRKITGVIAANGDGTPYLGPDRTTSGGGRAELLIDPTAAAAVTAVVRHRAPIRDLVFSRCGPGCPVDDSAIDRWRAPFLAPGGVHALVAILRQPLIGLTDQQETSIAVPSAILYSDQDTTFDRASAFAAAERLHTRLITGLSGARHLALLGEPQRFAAAIEPELNALAGH